MRLTTTGTNLLRDATFDIEFKGYLSNHAKHAIIALEGLQATPERVQEYWDTYTHLTPYNLPLHRVEWNGVDPCTPVQWDEWRGKKVHWPQQVAFMNTELKQRFAGDTDALVREYATPSLLQGQAGALTHGIIHLGWAIDAGSSWMISEGLAYLNFCHLGVDDSKLETNVHELEHENRLWESLVRVAKTFEEENLRDEWVQKSKMSHDETFHPELVVAGFQWQLSKVLHDAHPVATQLPGWIQTTPLESLWENLYKDVVKLYLATRDENGNGSFLILHAITSLWGLEHTVRLIDKESVSRHALGHYYSMLVCLLATSGFPALSTLEKARVDFEADNEKMNWDLIVKRGIAEIEEHNIKLVYVSRELWRRYGRWGGFSEASKSFTLTPNIGPSSTSFTASS